MDILTLIKKLFSFVTTSYTRGHDLKIVRKHSVVYSRAFHFISHWNSLSYSQVHANSVAAFRRSLTGIDTEFIEQTCSYRS